MSRCVSNKVIYPRISSEGAPGRVLKDADICFSSPEGKKTIGIMVNKPILETVREIEIMIVANLCPSVQDKIGLYNR